MTTAPARSPHGVRQDEEWAQFVAQLSSAPPRPFEEHWDRFQAIYRDRQASDGPPLAWQPTDAQIARSNLGRLMQQLGFDAYADLHRWSVSERATFWGRVIEHLGVVFSKTPNEILDLRNGVKNPRWLPGAELNCVDSCFTTKKDKGAIVLGREGSTKLEETSYGELESLTNRVANGIREHGFDIGDRIALYMPMTVECVAAYLGIVRAGCCAVSIADSFSPDELRKRLDASDASGVVTVDAFIRAGKTIRLLEKVKQADAPRAVVIPQGAGADIKLRSGDLLWTDLVASSDSFESVVGDPNSAINILFSSGTTGVPKAIPWTHVTPIKCGMDGHFHQDIQPNDVVAWPTNIGWMMGPWLIFAAFMNGATMALYEGAPLGPGFTRFVRAAKVTILGVVPSLVRAWRTGSLVEEKAWSDVRVLSSTGEPSAREDYLWLMSRAGYRAPIIEYLGGTEIGGGHITGTVVQPASPATFTTAALGTDFLVLDDDGTPVGDGELGELYLVPPSIGMSQQLLNADHEQVYYARCQPGPNGEVLRRHGDQMRKLHHGFFSAEGRADDAMNLGGVKVSSLELEQVLNGHQAVYESAAVGVQLGGEGAETLIVYVVLAREYAATQLKAELGSMIAKKLNPLFKIHDLVPTGELPRTASNKLMRRTLRARYSRATEDH